MHADLVLEANQRMNLTRITSPEDVIILHIADSLAFINLVAPMDGVVIDVGSGAGYPGIPLAIMGLDLRLCESVKKKAAFLEECVDSLGLRVPVHPVRAEEYAKAYPRQADVVVFRAVSSLASLVELASPLLREGGRAIALKSAVAEEERLGGSRAAATCGMRPTDEQRYTLPSGEKRSVLVYERRGRTGIALPRRPGLAQNHPLG
jgi:16S rRNA (guanine527-N7)-methyltransferase